MSAHLNEDQIIMAAVDPRLTNVTRPARRHSNLVFLRLILLDLMVFAVPVRVGLYERLA